MCAGQSHLFSNANKSSKSTVLVGSVVVALSERWVQIGESVQDVKRR